jgi:hypothetical protein
MSYQQGFDAQLASDGLLSVYDSVYVPGTYEAFQWLQGAMKARQMWRKRTAAEERLSLLLRLSSLGHSFSACQVVGVYPCY